MSHRQPLTAFPNHYGRAKGLQGLQGLQVPDELATLEASPRRLHSSAVLEVLALLAALDHAACLEHVVHYAKKTNPEEYMLQHNKALLMAVILYLHGSFAPSLHFVLCKY